jgi:two-component system chemotaxis response regulator CheY
MSHSVLIADDAAYMREMLRDILSQGGYEIAAEASDGDEAVQAYREHSPDLVTLDIVMPRKSGLDALREIMAIDPGASVIICSALGQEALVKDMMSAGAKGYLVKPFKPDQVLEVVGMVMAKQNQE